MDQWKLLLTSDLLMRSVINRSSELADIRPQLARECGRILAAIHSLDWQGADLAGELPEVDPATLAAFCCSCTFTAVGALSIGLDQIGIGVGFLVGTLVAAFTIWLFVKGIGRSMQKQAEPESVGFEQDA